MKTNLKSLALVTAATALVALTGCWSLPNANVQPQGQPGLIQGAIPVQIIQDSVTVAAVDASQRTITLKRSDGTSKAYSVADTVKNLDKVKVGDTVTADVQAELAVYILQNGRLPDGTTAESLGVNAKVLLVDPSYRLLTLQFASGENLTIKAGLDVQLEKMAPGDDVVVKSNAISAIKIK